MMRSAKLRKLKFLSLALDYTIFKKSVSAILIKSSTYFCLKSSIKSVVSFTPNSTIQERKKMEIYSIVNFLGYFKILLKWMTFFNLKACN